MIGAGIFTTSGLLIKELNDPVVMLLLWLVGGVIALCGALSYGELGATMPYAGGEYIFLSRLYHPLMGFLSGWVSFFVGFSAPIAASSIGFTEYIARAFPVIIDWGGIVNPVFIKKFYSILVIIIFTAIHLKGIEFGAIVQNYLTLSKVGLILCLLFIGFIFGKGNFNHFIYSEEFILDFKKFKILGLSLMWIMFAYSGWNASAYIGSEIKKPSRNLPLSLILGTGIVIILYFCLNIFYVFAIKPEAMKGVISVGGLAVKNLFGSSMESLFSMLISFALFSSLSAFIILGPRVYYSMAKDGYFFKFVSDVHPVSHIPSKSIILQCLIAVIMVLSGTFEQILTYMGFSLGIFPILSVSGIFRLRSKLGSKYKLPGYPLVQLIYIISGVFILFLSFLQRPVESSIAILTVSAGVPVYFIFKKRYITDRKKIDYLKSRSKK
ncbi:amino acid permease, partial [candidate division KSB1 bacterium]